MAKKLKGNKPERYQEGFIKGKRVFLVGVLPILALFGLIIFITWLIMNFYGKLTVNNDTGTGGVCGIVRNQYPSSIRADNPCETVDKGDYWLVTFTQNANTNSAPVYMTFKVKKSNNAVSSGIDADDSDN